MGTKNWASVATARNILIRLSARTWEWLLIVNCASSKGKPFATVGHVTHLGAPQQGRTVAARRLFSAKGTRGRNDA